MDAAYLRKRIRHYVDRGIFTGYTEEVLRGSKTVFRFRWLLNAGFKLCIDPNRREYICLDVLPNVPTRGFLDREIRKFLTGRTSSDLPEHRQADPHKVTLRFQNKKGNGSIHVQVAPGEQAYATKTLFTVINDLFTWLNLYHIEYLQEEFGLAEE